MKKTTLAALALLLTLAGCNLKEPLKVGYEEPRDLNAVTDSTIYGFCGRQSTPQVLQLISMSNDDTLLINVNEARRNGRVLGGYSPGDQLYVVAQNNHTEAITVINEKLLTNKWVEQSPYDGTTPVGINLKPGGDAEGIEQTDITYTKWNIVNGMLELVEVHEDGTGLESSQLYTIKLLTADSLQIFNRDESYEFGSLSKYKEDVQNVVLDEYDESEEDDFLRIFD